MLCSVMAGMDPVTAEVIRGVLETAACDMDIRVSPTATTAGAQ